MKTVEYEPVYFGAEDGGDQYFEYFDEESAVIELLAAGVLLVGGGYQSRSKTLELMVLFNDLFWWASADAEPCKPSELQGLYDAWLADKHWGVSIWCCHHRKLQPLRPVRERMQKDGVWNDALAALSEPGPS